MIMRRRSNKPAPSALAGILMPLILATVLVAVVVAMTYRRPAERAGDTNAGPSVQTVAPTPSPSTSPIVPTPNPTTESRPTP
jgi:hypothetical protein